MPRIVNITRLILNSIIYELVCNPIDAFVNSVKIFFNMDSNIYELIQNIGQS